MSAPTIKCNPEYKFDGFAPDPKDCSKFYRCEQNNEYEETSTGRIKKNFSVLDKNDLIIL
jgi:hypothetical protein